MRTALVIVAGGKSRRMQDMDKVWAQLGDRSVVAHSVDNLVPCVDSAVLVVREECLERAQVEFAAYMPRLAIVTGGVERGDSVARGLAALAGVEVVAVHDAARPLAKRTLLTQGFALLNDFQAAIPVLPVNDTIKEVDAEGRVLRTLNRASLRAAQTPQFFHLEPLVAAHRHAREAGVTATDDAALMERDGYRVTTFAGDGSNLKITTQEDLQVAALLLARKMVG